MKSYPGSWRWLLAVTLAATQAGRPAELPAAPESVAALRDAITRHAGHPRFARAQWGIHVVSLDTGRVLFTANADKFFIPASVTKLFTGALALDRLGPDFRIRTSCHAAARPDADGRLAGDLIVFGRGDPSLGTGNSGGDWDRAFAPLIDSLQRAGVRQITGDLVADEGFFRGPAIGSGWEHDDLLWYYAPEVSALSLANNAVDVVIRPGEAVGQPARVTTVPFTSYLTISNFTQTLASGTAARLEVNRALDSTVVVVKGRLPLDGKGATESISVPRPAAWFGHEFKAALARRGIGVGGGVRVVNAADRERAPLDLNRLVELAAVDTPPLRELLPRMMKPSQNLHAQLWLLQAGAAGPAAKADATSEQAGLAALTEFLQRVGVAPDEARFQEGTGLSRHNLVTPRALVGLLTAMTRHPQAAVFLDSLPVAGVDGTLRNRLRGTPAANNLRAKTGALSLVNTLAGYVTTAAGEKLAFALMLNNYPGAGRAELDHLAVLLAGLKQSSREMGE